MNLDCKKTFNHIMVSIRKLNSLFHVGHKKSLIVLLFNSYISYFSYSLLERQR